VITDFFDQMKSKSKGYASMEYQITGYKENDLVSINRCADADRYIYISYT